MEIKVSDLLDANRCIRDLVALSALPAVWVGHRPDQITDSLSKALLGVLRCDLIYVGLKDASAQRITFETAIVDGRPQTPRQAQEIGQALSPSLRPESWGQSWSIPHPIGAGELRIVAMPIGHEGVYGIVAAASSQLRFPSEVECLILGVAATQAMIAFQHTHATQAMIAFQHAQMVKDSHEIVSVFREKEEQNQQWLIREQAARAEAEKAKRHITDILESTTDAFMAFDRKWWVTDLNSRAERLFRKSRRELLAKNVWEVFPEAEGTRFYEEFHRAMNEQRPTEFEEFYAPLNMWVEVHAYSFAEGLSVFFRDISERKWAEEELFRTSKLESLSLVTAGIAHDFNNILTSAIGNISLARTALNPEGKIFRQLTEAVNACLRARDLTQQLLIFSKPGKPVMKTMLIDRVLQGWASFALQGTNVRYEQSIQDDLWPVEADEGQILEAIHNVVRNAQQAMPNGGVVRIRAHNVTLKAKDIQQLSPGEYIKISIEDSGLGIPPDCLDKVFDPFFTTKPKASGLGLTLSYWIVKKHGGHIDIESNPGEGTTVMIYLPRSKNAPVREVVSQETYVPGQGRILFMDEEAALRELAHETLTQLGYEVVCTQDGAEAIEHFKKAQALGRPFDAVILDLTVQGGLGGKETLQKLRELHPEVKAIICSGYSNDPVMVDFKAFGFSGAIAKPYTAGNLSNALSVLFTRDTK